MGSVDILYILNGGIGEMSNNTEPYIGYWFVEKSEASTLKVGQRVKNAKAGPPYMVVCEQIQSIIETSKSWPGRLWRVQVIKLGDMSNTIPNVWYRRAREIELIEELSIEMLFGTHGNKIVPLLNQITMLNSLNVDALYANSVEKSVAEAAYTRAWKYWNENLKYPRLHTYNDGITIGSPSMHDQEKSPINCGFSLISELIWKRAHELDGDEAFIEVVYYGEVEIELNPRWSAACNAFLYHAMALSMSPHLSSADFSVLTQSWSSVFKQKE